MQIPFHRPFITDDEINEVLDSLRSGWITTGPKVKRFEEEFAGYVGAKHAVALNSCTAALHLALDAVGIEEGDVVVTTPMTFAATAEVIRYFRAEPVFVDIEPDTLNIDPSRLEETVARLGREGRRVKAVIPVHYGGQPCDMDSIGRIAENNGLRIIEDAAHALPAKYKERNIGSIGDVTCFSFYATKTITTGEGGMVVTDNTEWAERIRVMSLHGISRDAWKRYTAEGNWHYDIVAPGFKYNMTDIAAAMGLAQLGKADLLREKRERISSIYSNAFKDLPQVEIPFARARTQHSWHLYVLKLNLASLSIDRSRFIEELKERGIGTSVHFIPLHMHQYYRVTYGLKPEDFPVAHDTYERIISLPIYPAMTDKDIERAVLAVSEVAGRFKR